MTFPDETKNRSNRFVPRETTALSEAPRENVPDQIVVKTACDEGAASSPEPSEPQPIIKASIENGMHFSTSNFIGRTPERSPPLVRYPYQLPAAPTSTYFAFPGRCSVTSQYSHNLARLKRTDSISAQTCARLCG